MTFMRMMVVLSICLVPLASSSRRENFRGAPTHPQAEKVVVLTVKKLHARLSYEVDSKPVTSLLDTLGQLVERRGEECALVIVLPWEATFKEEYEVEVMASKAGFKRLRPFLYNPERGFMAEVKYGPSIPFTTNPPLD